MSLIGKLVCECGAEYEKVRQGPPPSPIVAIIQAAASAAAAAAVAAYANQVASASQVNASNIIISSEVEDVSDLNATADATATDGDATATDGDGDASVGVPIVLSTASDDGAPMDVLPVVTTNIISPSSPIVVVSPMRSPFPGPEDISPMSDIYAPFNVPEIVAHLSPKKKKKKKNKNKKENKKENKKKNKKKRGRSSSLDINDRSRPRTKRSIKYPVRAVSTFRLI